MRIDENTVIKCNNLEEVSECLDMLKNLGFETFHKENSYELFVAMTFNNIFTNFTSVEVCLKNNFISFKTFQKIYNKQIKEKQPDLLVDKNGKVLKVNNNKKMYTIYFFDSFGEYINDTDKIGKALQDSINYVSYYISKEACEKALKRKEIENKLRLLAFELNRNREIDWSDYKDKYYICYEAQYHLIVLQLTNTYKGMNIYCYSEKFRNKAIELIGEEDLKDYLINC